VSGSVLIADGSRGRARQVREACSARGFATTWVPHGSAALESALGDVPDVVVAPVDLELIGGPKLAEILRANPRTQDVRFLLIGRLAPGAAEAAHVDEVLAPATDPDEVALRVEVMIAQRARLEKAWRHADGDHEVQGRLAQIPLVDLLQLFHMNRRTGTIEVTRREAGGREERGSLWVREGNLVQAASGSVEGEKALFRLLAWQEGSFAFTPGPVGIAPRILTPTRALLMEGMRQLDEWDRMRSNLPPLDSHVALKVRSSELPNVVHALTQEVLLLLEIHNTVQDVVDHCSHPDYQVLRTLETLIGRDLVDLRHGPSSPQRRATDGLFTPAQIRRLRDWLQRGRPRGENLCEAKLLVAAADPAASRDFARQLAVLPGMELEEPFASGTAREDDLLPVGRLAVDPEHSLQLVHVPSDPSFAPFWPVAAHGALGTLLLLSHPVDDAEAALRPLLAALRSLPAARVFHVMLLRKDERLGAEEIQAKMALLEDASLFLLPLEGGKDPVPLLRTMLARVIP
jgi:CheY-like chemotaxis protein